MQLSPSFATWQKFKKSKWRLELCKRCIHYVMCKRCNICQNIYVYIYIYMCQKYIYIYIYVSKICVYNIYICQNIYRFIYMYVYIYVCIYIICGKYVIPVSRSLNLPNGGGSPSPPKSDPSCLRAFSSEKWPLKLFCWRIWRGCFKPRGRMSSKRKPCFFADCNFFYWKEMDSSIPYFPIHQQSRKHTRSPILK